METFIIRALQLILCLSLLIVLHEGGHFFFAKLFKVRVEKFCLFFDPWFTPFKWKPKHSDTTYAIGWLPLGGYVKIAGMIDESMDTQQMKQPAQPWEFRSHPAWQRLFIMIGGVLVNFLVALFIYSMILFHWGDTYIPMSQMKMGMKFNTQAKALGFEDGDILLRTDTKAFKSFDSNTNISDTYRDISTARYVVVNRKGREVKVNIPDGGLNMLEMFRAETPFVLPYLPSRIDTVLGDGAAAKAAIKAGDRIVAFNGTPLETWGEYNSLISRMHKRLKGAPTDDSLQARHVTVAICHAATGKTDTLHMMLDNNLMMGVGQSSLLTYYKPVTQHYGFFSSFPAGINHGVQVLKGYVGDLKYIFTKEGAQSIGSFGAIGSMFPAYWSWYRFWELTAFISIILAFMNILPIPALDGGHVLFLIIEMVTRRKPSDKVMERAELIGISLLLLLMVWAIRNDIVNFLIK